MKNTGSTGAGRTSSKREQVRAMQAKQEKASKRKNLLIRLAVIGVSIAAIVALVIFINVREPAEQADFSTGMAPAAVNEAGGVVLTSSTDVEEYDELDSIVANEIPSHDGMYRVDERIIDDRPHVIIYTDPACPYCADFEEAHHQYLESMLDNEQITLEYRSIAFLDAQSGMYSSRAINSFMCVAEESPENYFDFIGNITAAGASPSGSELADLAEENYGVNIEDCVSNNDYRALAQYNTNLASASGVAGTPTVLVDGYDWAEHGGTFAELLEEVLDGTVEGPATPAAAE